MPRAINMPANAATTFIDLKGQMAIKCDMTGILQIPETDPLPFVTGKAVLVDMDSTVCTKRFMFLTASKLLIKVGTFHLLTYHNGT